MMKQEHSWQSLDFYQNRELIKEIIVSIDQNHTPANNQWEFLYPVLDIFFLNKPIIFYILYRNEKAVLALPVTQTNQHKFFYRWSEVGFPYHSHINLISMTNKPSHAEMTSLLRNISTDGFKWDRFSIRHIFSPHEVDDIDDDLKFYKTDYVAWFNTASNLSINDIVSKKHLRNIKRQEKKLLSEAGEIDFNCNKESLELSLSEFSELEHKGWKGKSGVAIYSSSELSDMYKIIAKNFGHNSMKVFQIRTKDTLLASALGFGLGNTLYIHKVSFSSHYSSFSPGNILLSKILEYSIESKNLDIVNLVTFPKWAARWHPNKSPKNEIIIYNSTMKGLCLNLCIRLWRGNKPLLKRVIKAFKAIIS